jgi:hypothetical protein
MFLRSVLQLLVSVNVVPSSPILVTLMMEAICSSEWTVLKEPRGVTPQKTAFLMVTIIKTSNLTREDIQFPKRCFLVFRIPDDGNSQ